MPTPSPQFRPGDRVRRTQPNESLVVGEIYTVTEINEYGHIRLEGHDQIFSSKYFVKVEPKKKASGFKAFQQKLKKV